MNFYLYYIDCKINLVKTLLLFIISFTTISSGIAQTQRCGTDSYMAARFAEEPNLAQRFSDWQDEITDQIAERIDCSANNEIQVPLAFHFDSEFSCNDEACIISKVLEQIDVLNTDFASNTSSPNAANCSGANPAISTGTCVTFYLAQPPSCANSNTTTCDAAITIGEFSGGYAVSGSNGAGSCWDDYLNVFVVRNFNLLGVADQIPDAFTAPGPGEGVTVVASAFGGPSGPCGPLDTDGTYNTGQTLSHEIGHYLGCFHTFEGGCSDEPNNQFGGTSINVDDTPPQSQPYFGCTSSCENSGCGGNQQTANIMNYTDDACMDMFSEDQARAMNIVANGLFGNLSIAEANPNLSDLLGLCPSGDCVLDCVVGAACDDNDACTTGETFDASCNCSGGVFQDSDNDGVCNADDVCPGGDDNLDDDLDGIPNDCDSVCDCSDAAVTMETFTVSTGNNDVEESNTGSMNLTSGDLDMVMDSDDASTTYKIGLRYQNLNIPDNGGISGANLKFQVDEASSGSASFNIQIENSTNSAAFTTSNSNLSNRNYINTNVSWSNVPSWNNVGDSGPNQTSVDISSLLNAVIQQNGLAANNAMTLMITGTGIRTADSYEGNGTGVELVVSFSCQDDDGDNIPNTCDICPGGDDNVDTDGNGIPDFCEACEIADGTTCDDGDICTINDIYTDCECAGTFADADGDGVCDAEDCESDPATMGSFAGDMFLMESCSGIIMTTPTGDCFKIVVNDSGQLSSQIISCPE